MCLYQTWFNLVSHLSHGPLVRFLVDIGVECKVANDDRIEILTELLDVVLEVRVTAINDAGLRGPEEVLDGNVERIDDEEGVR